MHDLIILGGGPAGYRAAERAGHGGLKTLLIERHRLGGVCLNEGCIPSKTLLHSAKLFDYARQGDAYGVAVTGAALDHQAVLARKDKIVRNLVAGIKARLKASHVTVKAGHGRILGRENGQVRVQVGEEIFTAPRLLVATGSEAVIPPIPGVKDGLASGFVLTHREILDLETVPESLVIVGGGVIGLEMASYFNSVGSQVTVIEMLDRIAAPTDREIAALLQRNYEKKGAAFKLGARVTGLPAGAVEFEDAGRPQRLTAERVLLAIGRRPVITGFGLDTLGVLVEAGRIVVDARGQTSVPGVYAAGDVNGVWMLAHAAYREAEVIVNTLLGRPDRVRYQAMPSVIYTSPEVGCVGETEESCKARSIDYRVATLPMNHSGRYMAENAGGDGICKVLADPVRRRLIGCHIIGSYASEIVTTAAMLIETEMTIDDIKEFIFPHPSVSEILREALFHL